MQFLSPAPANLTQDGATFYADWSVADTNFGYTKAQVEAWVSSALNNPLGIEATGIVTRQVASGNVVFQVVQTIPGPAGTIGVAHWGESPVRVELEAALYNNMDLVTHEALHAFLFASHSPEGSISILEPIEDPGEEWLSATDISQIQAWLGAAPADLKYWFPGDLEHYITKWEVPAGSKTRLLATVIDGAPCALKAVYATTHAAMLSGSYTPFGRGLDVSLRGFWHTSWQVVPASGDLYIGLIVDGATPADFQELIVGLAEVQLIAEAEPGSGTPIPN